MSKICSGTKNGVWIRVIDKKKGKLKEKIG